jgi:hypothetical protein
MKMNFLYAVVGCLLPGLGVPLYYLINLHGLYGALVWIAQQWKLTFVYIGVTCLLGGAIGFVAGWIVSITLRWVFGAGRPWAKVVNAVISIMAGGIAGLMLGSFSATVVLFSQLENTSLW